jgi:ubiquinone/menaquinone biosynthesis C-methylase UbiE
MTDRIARRPHGRTARATYSSPTSHDFAWPPVLGVLALEPDDRLLDIGCGGGLLLRDALATGASATGLDHSPDMVRLAAERAPAAEVVAGNADALPFSDAAFTAVSMSIVLMFLAEPVAALRECHRVLEPGGRLAVYTTAPELRGTPAAPEPLAGLAHFHTDAELEELGLRAGFQGVAVAGRDGGQLLTARR